MVMALWMLTNLLFISCALYAKSTFTTKDIDNKNFVVSQNNKNIKAVVLKSLVTSSKLQCGHRCNLQIGCENINYNLKTKECELLDRSIQSLETKVVENWISANLVPRCPVFYHKNEFALTRSSIITTIPFWSRSWKISFDIKPFEIISTTHPSSILHFTIDGDRVIHGSRTPGVWFRQGTTKLAVFASINGNHNYQRDATQDLPLNMVSHIEISQLYQSSGTYLFSFKINGKEDFSILNNDARQFYNVKVYTSDPWYDAAKATISNLLLYSLQN